MCKNIIVILADIVYERVGEKIAIYKKNHFI